jgi:hypothetical protein
MACTIRQMCDFAGWPVLGWLSPGGIPCLGSVFPLRYRVLAKSSSFPTPAVIDVHITPDVGAISSAPRAPVANRAHRRNNLSRSATGRSHSRWGRSARALVTESTSIGQSGSILRSFEENCRRKLSTPYHAERGPAAHVAFESFTSVRACCSHPARPRRADLCAASPLDQFSG